MFKLNDTVYTMFNNNIVERRIAKVEEIQKMPSFPVTRIYFYLDQSNSFRSMSEKRMFYSKKELVMETFNVKLDFQVGE